MSTDPLAATPPLRFVQPRPWIRWLIVTLAAAAWFISLQLLLGSAGVDSALLEAICKAGGGADDCRAVLNSRFAYWGRGDGQSGGIPVAGIGMAYFAFLALWFLLVGTPTRRRWAWHLVALAVLAFGVFVSLNLVYVMSSVLHRWCLGCVATHALNGAIAVLALLAWPPRSRPNEPPHPGPRLGLAALLACTAVGVGHMLWLGTSAGSSRAERLLGLYTAIIDDPAYIRWNYERQPIAEIPPRADDSPLGQPDAANTVVVFADFQCPRCAELHELLEKLVRDHPQRLRVEYRHFPADPECNPNPRYKSGGHPVACKAARAAEAVLDAAGPAAFHEMCRRMFAEQRDIETRPFATRAVAAGVKSEQAFDAAWYSQAVADRVQRDIQLAEKLGVESVPAVFLNGRRLENWRKRETWEALLGIAPPATQPTTGPIRPE